MAIGNSILQHWVLYHFRANCNQLEEVWRDGRELPLSRHRKSPPFQRSADQPDRCQWSRIHSDNSGNFLSRISACSKENFVWLFIYNWVITGFFIPIFVYLILFVNILKQLPIWNIFELHIGKQFSMKNIWVPNVKSTVLSTWISLLDLTKLFFFKLELYALFHL